MMHLVRIDKGPVMDWTNDIGLGERYRKWKKHVEVLFKGPLNAVAEGVKCNYIIYWSGDHGMELVDKWTAEGKITDATRIYKIPIGHSLRDTYILKPINYLQ